METSKTRMAAMGPVVREDGELRNAVMDKRKRGGRLAW